MKISAVLLLVFLVSMATISFAIQDRRPVDPPSPAPNDPEDPPECPVIFLNLNCNANGSSSDKVCIWALSQAGYDCDAKLQKCRKIQTSEMYANKSICEQVSGCKLKYKVEEDECEKGNLVTDCTPAPGTSDPANTNYTCKISGSYNITGYHCDRNPAGEGEFEA